MRTRFQNREEQLMSWREFRRQLLDTYASPDRRERAEREIQARVQLPNESVTAFVEDMTCLFRRADPGMSKGKKLRNLMRGMKEQLFAGLVRNPPKTVAEFLAEGVSMEKMLQNRSNAYERQVNATTDIFTAIGNNKDNLRELIRTVVREEIHKVYDTPQATVSSIASVIKDEVNQAPRSRLSNC